MPQVQPEILVREGIAISGSYKISQAVRYHEDFVAIADPWYVVSIARSH